MPKNDQKAIYQIAIMTVYLCQFVDVAKEVPWRNFSLQKDKKKW